MSTENKGTGGDVAPDVNAVRAEATAAEQTRIAGIIGADEAKGREPLANHFAFKTTMSVEDALVALAAASRSEPTVAAPATPGASALAAAMAASGGGADVSTEGGDEGEDKKKATGGLLKAATDLGYATAATTH